MPISELLPVRLPLLLALVVGCRADAPTAAQVPVSAASSAAASAAAAPAAAPPPVPRKVVAAPGPPSEASQVITGEGHRYEVPSDFVRVDHGGAPAYRGNVRGPTGIAEVTYWATRETFDGDLEALAGRERAAVTAAGGTIPAAGLLAGGPVMLMIGDTVARGGARRMKIEHADRLELRTIAVHHGAAHIFHCETPKAANAWANIGSECVARSTTFRLTPG